MNETNQGEDDLDCAGGPILRPNRGPGGEHHPSGQTRGRRRRVGCILALFVFSLMLIVFMVAIWRVYLPARRAAMETECISNLFQVGFSVMEYHQVVGKLPPAFEANRAGKPWVSWRVLVTREGFAETRPVVERYRFDEPWNGPHNRTLADHSWGDLFTCPFERGSGHTNYVAVVGPNTLWPGPRGRSLDELSENSSEKILLIEIPNSDIPWMEPRDITFEQAVRVFSEYNASRNQPRRRHLHCYTTQERVRDLDSIPSIEEFKGMLEVK